MGYQVNPVGGGGGGHLLGATRRHGWVDSSRHMPHMCFPICVPAGTLGGNPGDKR